MKNKALIDMTSGNPIKQILFFMLPLLIGNIFQQVYSLVDTMVVGYAFSDDAGISAIGATSSLYGLFINFAWGLNSGYGLVVSKKYGAKDILSVKKSIAIMIYLNIIIAIILTTSSLIFINPLLNLLNVPHSIFNLSKSYILVLIAGMIATIIYNMLAGIMRALGNSKIPLYFLIIASILNSLLDLLFVVVFKLGVQGAALATIISQLLCAIFCSIYFLTKYKEVLPQKEHFKNNKILLKDMLSTGFGMALMICVVDVGSVVYQSSINDLGDMYISSHTSARRLIGIFMMPLSSIATTNSTFVSQNFGAKKIERIKSTFIKVIFMEVIWSVFSFLFILLFRKILIGLITGSKNSEMIENAFFSLICHFSCYIALGILLVLRTTMQATGQKIIPIISSMFELIIKVIFGLFIIAKFGFISVCIAEPIIWIICMIFLILAFIIKKPFKRSEIRD